ncbi:DMT family transporter [Rhodobacteraceae bacterium]|nr:DMT family transporter [Paracoccaceae bacterium]
MTSLKEEAPPARRVENAAGLVLMGVGMFLFSAVDAAAKFLTVDLHPFQIVWTRQLGLFVGALVLLAIHGPALFRTKHLNLQIARGLVAVCSASAFIFALRHVALADAVAVSFVAPFMVTLMGAFILGETVGLRRWIAITLGFVGTLIILRPGMGVVHPAAGLVLIAAFFFAVRQIISRAISDTDKTPTTVVYTAFIGFVVLAIPLPWIWETPTGLHLWILLGMAILAGIAEVCVIRALELALAVVLAPIHYTLILWGTFYGWLVFDQLPDIWTWTGAAIIVVTGIYTLRREYLAKAVV